MSKLICKSENCSENYLARIIKVDNLTKHPNADKLQITNIDGNKIITNMNTQVGDVRILFVLESALAPEYLTKNNDYRNPALNDNQELAGFFESSGRVRAARLRSIPSEGYMVPVETLSFMLSQEEIDEIKRMVGEEFDTVKDLQLCKKYVVKSTKQQGLGGGEKKPKEDKLKKLMVEKQFKFHEETLHLGKNMFHIQPDDEIVITYKVHGSSSIISNVLIKKDLNLFQKFLNKLGAGISDEEYGYIYSSGKPKSRLPKAIVKSTEKPSYMNPNGDFYKSDIWKRTFDDHRSSLKKGISIYSEIVGFTQTGEYIQKNYDYGCKDNEYKKFVYRINFTNVDGVTVEFTWNQIKEYCEYNSLETVPELYKGLARDLFPDLDVENHWAENFVERLKERYLEGDCYMSQNNIPAEGIVINKYNSLHHFVPFKLKSFRFIEHETKQMDKGEVDMESQESEGEGE